MEGLIRPPQVKIAPPLKACAALFEFKFGVSEIVTFVVYIALPATVDIERRPLGLIRSRIDIIVAGSACAPCSSGFSRILRICMPRRADNASRQQTRASDDC